MKPLTLLLLLAGLFTNGYSQDIMGKWYMINRSGLVEIEITEDSIFHQKLFSDFTPKQKPRKSQSYLNIQQLGNKILIISQARKDTATYYALTITDLIKGESFKMVWNTLDTVTTTIDDLIEVHKQDKRELFGYLVFHESYIDTLKQLKEIDDMAIEDFRKYAARYVANIKKTRDEFDKYNIGYVFITYNFQIIVQSLFEIGYNPIQNVNTMNKLYTNFADDPEVEVIFKEIKER